MLARGVARSRSAELQKSQRLGAVFTRPVPTLYAEIRDRSSRSAPKFDLS